MRNLLRELEIKLSYYLEEQQGLVMTESTDEDLSRICRHCARRFHVRRYVNRHNKLDGRVVPAKYCSTKCRVAAHRIRASGDVTDLGATELPPRSVTALEAVPRTPSARSAPLSSYDRLLGDAVPSRWEPSGSGLDMPDIPEFLQRY